MFQTINHDVKKLRVLFLIICSFLLWGCSDLEKEAMSLYLEGRSIVDEVDSGLHKGNESNKLTEAILKFESIASNYPTTHACQKILAVASDPYTIRAIKIRQKSINSNKCFDSSLASCSVVISEKKNIVSSQSQFLATATILVGDLQNSAFPDDLISWLATNCYELPDSPDIEFSICSSVCDSCSKKNYKTDIIVAGSTVEERFLKVIKGEKEDFAIKIKDFNEDGFSDCFFEIKTNINKFQLIYYDGKTALLTPLNISLGRDFWDSIKNESIVHDKPFALCLSWPLMICHDDRSSCLLGVLDGKPRTAAYNLLGGWDCEEGEFELSDSQSVEIKSQGSLWTVIADKTSNLGEVLMNIPTKNFVSLGFIWGNNVNVRTSPDITSKVLYQLNNGRLVNIYDGKNGWSQITVCSWSFGKLMPSNFDYTKEPQWIKNDYLRHIPPHKKRDSTPSSQTEKKSMGNKKTQESE